MTVRLPASKFALTGFAALSLLVLASCESMGHLYPANDLAEQISASEMPAHFTSMATGTGTIEAIGPAGEVLKGSYDQVKEGYVFGPIFKAVYGDYSINPAHADNGTPTVATLSGNKGTVLQCEFYNNDSTGNGFGGCKSAAGALYRLQY
jgi:hypothetical protein